MFPRNNNLPSTSAESEKICSNDNFSKFPDDYCLKGFRFIRIIGRGTSGLVYLARENSSGLLKAVKRVYSGNNAHSFPKTTIQEMRALKLLHHPNIIQFHACLAGLDHHYLIFDFCDYDLDFLLKHTSLVFSYQQIGSIIKQLACAINYCHRRAFIHRDVKPSNILVDENGCIKLADFGLARLMHSDPKRPYTNLVVTQWYRSPELLLGDVHYGPAVDIWSLGCVMAEMFLRQPLFKAENPMEQIICIANLCGHDPGNVWPDSHLLPNYKTLYQFDLRPRVIREEFSFLPPDSLDILDTMLQLDPTRRCSAEQALRSKWLLNINPLMIAPPKFPNRF